MAVEADALAITTLNGRINEEDIGSK